MRIEDGPAVLGNDDVNDAYANLGAASDTYDELAGIDLTDLIGVDRLGTTSLDATVRWCYRARTWTTTARMTSAAARYPNAFWDGTQMVFGAGYAGADDVVGHELTHGFVQHTSGLFSLHQSGAINESVADTMGEIVDHRNPLSPTATPTG